jgi:hypothetical protein
MDDEKEPDDAAKATETEQSTETGGEGNENDDGDEYFEVEKILDEYKIDGQLFYKIRWKGYSSEHDSPEPASEIAHCVDIVAEWERTKAARAKRQGTRFP